MGVVAIVLLVSRVEIGLEGFSTLKYDHFAFQKKKIYDHFVHFLPYALVHIPTSNDKIL